MWQLSVIFCLMPTVITSLLISYDAIIKNFRISNVRMFQRYFILLIIYAIYLYFTLSFTTVSLGFYCYEYTLAIFISHYISKQKGKLLFIATPSLVFAYFLINNDVVIKLDIKLYIIGVVLLFASTFIENSKIPNRDVKILLILTVEMIITIICDFFVYNLDDFKTAFNVEILVFLGSIIIIYFFERFFRLQERQRDEINTALKNGQIDKLTGTYNFTAFEEYSEFVSKEYDDYSVSILDLDNFKKFNDSYGHLEGNRVLATFSQIMQDTMKMFMQESEYKIFRFGGEEFVIVFLNKRSQEVKNFLIALEVDLKTYYEEEETPDYKVTFSAGIKRIREKTFNGVNLAVELADKTLYKAKEDGRDRIYTYEEVFGTLNQFEF
ncbi:hypothetical protein BG262_06170 [Floricoccus penangensis]|uniref:GGDEF domain-containing protein n=1 Tax=Floricoccus penangensis TaxID=1859475 RepID=A0A9Q5JFU1_9LACT|nr:GGDEF domain-containing protein [Floricoccus penangensis]OFI46068.1 hypothetical protein BG262_06170 [Floricoccus penangensis]